MRKAFEAEEVEAQRLAAQQEAREKVLVESREAMGRSRQADKTVTPDKAARKGRK